MNSSELEEFRNDTLYGKFSLPYIEQVLDILSVDINDLQFETIQTLAKFMFQMGSGKQDYNIKTFIKKLNADPLDLGIDVPEPDSDLFKQLSDIFKESNKNKSKNYYETLGKKTKKSKHDEKSVKEKKAKNSKKTTKEKKSKSEKPKKTITKEKNSIAKENKKEQDSVKEKKDKKTTTTTKSKNTSKLSKIKRIVNKQQKKFNVTTSAVPLNETLEEEEQQQQQLPTEKELEQMVECILTRYNLQIPVVYLKQINTFLSEYEQKIIAVVKDSTLVENIKKDISQVRKSILDIVIWLIKESLGQMSSLNVEKRRDFLTSLIATIVSNLNLLLLKLPTGLPTLVFDIEDIRKSFDTTLDIASELNSLFKKWNPRSGEYVKDMLKKSFSLDEWINTTDLAGALDSIQDKLYEEGNVKSKSEKLSKKKQTASKVETIVKNNSKSNKKTNNNNNSLSKSSNNNKKMPITKNTKKSSNTTTTTKASSSPKVNSENIFTDSFIKAVSKKIIEEYEQGDEVTISQLTRKFKKTIISMLDEKIEFVNEQLEKYASKKGITIVSDDEEDEYEDSYASEEAEEIEDSEEEEEANSDDDSEDEEESEDEESEDEE